jgi:hypothetical protein
VDAVQDQHERGERGGGVGHGEEPPIFRAGERGGEGARLALREDGALGRERGVGRPEGGEEALVGRHYVRERLWEQAGEGGVWGEM